MSPFESIEEELRRRDLGWWDRIVHAIPELETLAGTPNRNGTMLKEMWPSTQNWPLRPVDPIVILIYPGPHFFTMWASLW